MSASMIQELAEHLGVHYPELTPWEERYGSPYVKEFLWYEFLLGLSDALELDELARYP